MHTENYYLPFRDKLSFTIIYGIVKNYFKASGKKFSVCMNLQNDDIILPKSDS